jgi:hypothetical protein
MPAKREWVPHALSSRKSAKEKLKGRYSKGDVAILIIVILVAGIIYSSLTSQPTPTSPTSPTSTAPFVTSTISFASQATQSSSLQTLVQMSDLDVSHADCIYGKTNGEVWLKFDFTFKDRSNRFIYFKRANITVTNVVLSNDTEYNPKKNASIIYGSENGTQWRGSIAIPIAGPSFGNGQAKNAIFLVQFYIQGQTQPVTEQVQVPINGPWDSYPACY